MKSILDSLTDIFTPTDNTKIMKHEIVALSNVISVAKERLWIADSLEAIEYDSDNFSEDVTLIDTIRNIKQSIMVMEKFLEKHRET